MAESSPIGSGPDNHLLGLQPRPTSALANPNLYDCLDANQMPQLDDTLTTSLKSVFDCDLGCFVNSEDGKPVAYVEDANHQRRIVHMSDLDPQDV